MSDSLREQLLKAGLATEQDVRRVKADKHRQKRHSQNRPKDQRSRPDEAAQQAGRAQAEKRARDRQLNRRREEERRRQADEKAARDLVIKHEIPHGREGDVAFHFTRDARIKHVYVSPEQQRDLVAGRLAIARTRGRFRLVPREIAERVKPVAPFLVAYLGGGDTETDDPAYEEHPVPDDLMW